jgi:hypothetical protein
MIMVALKSTTLSAICGAFLSAVAVGAASVASLSIANPAMAAVKKYDPNCIKDCNDVVDACMGKAHSPAPMRACDRSYTNCVSKCKSQIE